MNKTNPSPFPISKHSYYNVDEAIQSPAWQKARKLSFRNSYAYLVFALILLLMSWEWQQVDTAIAGGAIPEEAIRVRILANSDSPVDQAMKRIVQEQISMRLDTLLAGSQTIEEARQSLMDQLPAIEELAAEQTKARGFGYGAKAQLGIVDFPSKVFGGTVYPQGEYETLLITLGAGEGENWWCVLFPPLCLTGAVAEASGDAKVEEVGVSAKVAAVDAGQSVATTADVVTEGEEPEVKFFLWELLSSIGNWLRSLFS